MMQKVLYKLSVLNNYTCFGESSLFWRQITYFLIESPKKYTNEAIIY